MDMAVEDIGRSPDAVGALVAKLRDLCVDWNGEPIFDDSTPRYEPLCRDIRAAADEIERLYGLVKANNALARMNGQHRDAWRAKAVARAQVIDWIDGEAPTREPFNGPTVGFPPSRDPEVDDGNDLIREAFDEGVVRGLWIAANMARTVLRDDSAAPEGIAHG